MEKEMDVRCFIDDEEVDCKELQESEEQWIKLHIDENDDGC